MTRILLTLILFLTACSPARQVVTPTPTPTVTPAERVRIPPAETYGKVSQCTVTAEALHIRSGPGIEHPVTGYLYAGDIVTVINQRGAWLETRDGWIHSHYCEE